MTQWDDGSAAAGPEGPRRSGSSIVAPLIAAAGLVVLLGVSLYVTSILGAFGSSGPDTGPNQSLAPGATEPPIINRPTPNPTAVTTPPPDLRPTVTGTILFSRAGNIWAASGLDITQVSNKDTDSSPAWSPDGKTIYFVQTINRPDMNAPDYGTDCSHLSHYYFSVPNIMSMAADGSDRTMVYNSQFKKCGGAWYSHVLQPDVSPDGKTLAVVSDGVDGLGDVVLTTLPASGGRLTPLRVREVDGLGHNDPAWSPDGTKIAFTYNAKHGTDGAPMIGIYTPATHKLSLLRHFYAAPSWSPDGRYIAAEHTTGKGRDIVVLDPGTGAEVARLTNDGASFAPVWSPNGDQIAFLHRNGLGVDLWVMTLDTGSSITLVDTKPVTQDGSIDAESPPAWFIPPEQRTVITPPPATEAPSGQTPTGEPAATDASPTEAPASVQAP